MYGGCQKKPCDNQTCVSPTNIELDPNYVGSQCYTIYKKYYNYYGSFTYADKWVTSAVEGTVFLEGGTVTNRLADFSQARRQLPRFCFDPPVRSPIMPQTPQPPPPAFQSPSPPPTPLSTLRPRTRCGRRRRSRGRLSWPRGCTPSANSRTGSTTAKPARTSFEVATTTRRTHRSTRGTKASPLPLDPSRALRATAGR